METIKNKAFLEIDLCGEKHTIESNEVEITVFKDEEEMLNHQKLQSTEEGTLRKVQR